VAKHRPDVPEDLKERLRAEVGGKCANPGCTNRRTHLHHIREWAVYQTHDEKHMVAVCPACHDAIHHGELPISDEEVYRWKSTSRPGVIRDHVYVEPGSHSLIVLGSISVTAMEGMVVFELSPINRLSLRILEGDILLLDLRVSDMAGREICSVSDNHLKHSPSPDLTYLRVPGRVQLTTPALEPFVPQWLINGVRVNEPDYARSGEVTLISAHVLRPGVVKVQGVWLKKGHAVVATETKVHFVREHDSRPIAVAGEGEQSVLHYFGPITGRLFGFE
jgi:hypothetical protein